MPDTPPSSSGLGPLDREGLVQRVAKRLSKAIVTGEIAAGDRLSESVVARDLGVSRAPVREAARLLESSGLVTYVTNRGFFVRKISAQALDDLYELRLVIETAAVRRLIRNALDGRAPGEVTSGLGPAEAPLRTQLANLYEVAKPGHDMLTQVEADMAFHRSLCAGSGNPKLLSVFDQIATETEFSIMVIGRLYDDPHRMAETHEPILSALSDLDEPGAVEAIRYHVEVAREIVTEQFRLLEEGALPT